MVRGGGGSPRGTVRSTGFLSPAKAAVIGVTKPRGAPWPRGSSEADADLAEISILSPIAPSRAPIRGPFVRLNRPGADRVAGTLPQLPWADGCGSVDCAPPSSHDAHARRGDGAGGEDLDVRRTSAPDRGECGRGDRLRLRRRELELAVIQLGVGDREVARGLPECEVVFEALAQRGE